MKLSSGDTEKKFASEYYRVQYEIGLEYQDFISKHMLSVGWPIVSYGSRKYQYEHGENALGIEIKRDGRFWETGNLFIELCEKSRADKASFTPSGIYRKDNSIFYLIGDEYRFWIFSKKVLQWVDEKKCMEYKEIPTSKGYLLPVSKASFYALYEANIGERPEQPKIFPHDWHTRNEKGELIQ